MWRKEEVDCRMLEGGREEKEREEGEVELGSQKSVGESLVGLTLCDFRFSEDFSREMLQESHGIY